MKQKEINKSVRSLAKAIKGYASEIKNFKEVDYTEFEMLKLNTIHKQIENFWVEKCTVQKN